MRKNVKESLIDIIPTILDAHEIALKYAKSGEIDLVMSVFTECQEAMVKIGEVIEENEGENHKTIEFLQSYCDELYEVSLVIAENNEPNLNKLFKRIALKLKDVLYSIKNDIKVKQEIVFMPYKASMWDALESVWKAADEDPDCDAYVVPIPYYDRKNDFSFGEMHYEGEDFPDYVPITHYNAYNLETRHPDAIYIHNPYDECNYVTSVDPRFYSSELKNYTDCLVYIPYFVVDENATKESISHFVLTQGVINADKVVVQSERIRGIYIDVLLEQFGDTKETRTFLENKVIGLGSPKFDKILKTKKDDIKVPEEWQEIIRKPDGTNKKIVFYNTTIGNLLRNSELYLEKMKCVFEFFKSNCDEITLLWRPHPLLMTTIDSLRPDMKKEYQKLINDYKTEKWGIYDDTSDLHRSIAFSDNYYGDAGSVIQLYQKTSKPIMFQNVLFNKKTTLADNNKDSFVANYIEPFYSPGYDGEFVWFVATHTLSLYKINFNKNKVEDVVLIPQFNNSIHNSYGCVSVYGNKVICFPDFGEYIVIYDKVNNTFDKVHIDKGYENKDKKIRCLKVYLVNGIYYMVCTGINMVITFDPNSNQILNCYKMDNMSPEDVFGFENIICNNKIYIPLLSKPEILEFDILKKEYQIHKLKCSFQGFNTICYVNESFYLTGRGFGLLQVDKEFKHVEYIRDGFDNKNIYIGLSVSYELINTYNTFDTQYAMFFKSYSNGEDLFLLPYGSNEIYTIDMKKLIVSTIRIDGEKDNCDEKTYSSTNYVANINFGGFYFQNENIIIYSEENRVFYSIDCKNKNYNILNPNMEKSQIDLLSNVRFAEKIVNESKSLTLEDFIKYVFSNSRDSIDDDLCEICGNEIYMAVLNDLINK